MSSTPRETTTDEPMDAEPITEVDPSALKLSDQTARSIIKEPSEDFVKNVGENGLTSIPLIRPIDEGYEVLVGQRRIRAAVRAGLESVTAYIVDWSDAEAIKRSFSDNAFHQELSKADKAMAVWNLLEAKGQADPSELPSRKIIGDALGVSPRSASRWMEPLRMEWRDTWIDPRYSYPDDEAVADDFTENIEFDRTDYEDNRIKALDRVSYEDLKTVRQLDADKADRALVIAALAEGHLSSQQIDFFKQASDSDNSPFDLNRFLENKFPANYDGFTLRTKIEKADAFNDEIEENIGEARFEELEDDLREEIREELASEAEGTSDEDRSEATESPQSDSDGSTTGDRSTTTESITEESDGSQTTPASNISTKVPAGHVEELSADDASNELVEEQDQEDTDTDRSDDQQDDSTGDIDSGSEADDGNDDSSSRWKNDEYKQRIQEQRQSDDGSSADRESRDYVVIAESSPFGTSEADRQQFIQEQSQEAFDTNPSIVPASDLSLETVAQAVGIDLSSMSDEEILASCGRDPSVAKKRDMEEDENEYI